MTSNRTNASFLQNPGWVLLVGAGLAALGIALQPRVSGQQAPQATPSIPSYATSDSNDRMIAVTGIDVTGSSVLYVIDTLDRRLSVYQANGGSESLAGVRWVGARNIDLDFRVNGWNDRSQFSYGDLEKKFADGVREGNDEDTDKR